MIESQQVLEWMAEGEVKDAARKLLRVLEVRFKSVPADIADKVRATTDLAELDRWFGAALAVKSLQQVRKLIHP